MQWPGNPLPDRSRAPTPRAEARLVGGQDIPATHRDQRQVGPTVAHDLDALPAGGDAPTGTVSTPTFRSWGPATSATPSKRAACSCSKATCRRLRFTVAGANDSWGPSNSRLPTPALGEHGAEAGLVGQPVEGVAGGAGTGSAPAGAFQPPTTGISLAAITDDNAAAQCRALLGDPNEVATKVLLAADLAYDWKASLGELVPTDRAPSRTSLGCRITRLGTNSMEHLAVSITAGDQAAGNTEVPAPAGSGDSDTTIGFKLQADAP